MMLFSHFLAKSADGGQTLPDKDPEPEPELDDFQKGILQELKSTEDPTLDQVTETGVDAAAKAGKPMYKRFTRWLCTVLVRQLSRAKDEV
jgi:hypothetical protein